MSLVAVVCGLGLAQAAEWSLGADLSAQRDLRDGITSEELATWGWGPQLSTWAALHPSGDWLELRLEASLAGSRGSSRVQWEEGSTTYHEDLASRLISLQTLGWMGLLYPMESVTLSPAVGFGRSHARVRQSPEGALGELSWEEGDRLISTTGAWTAALGLQLEQARGQSPWTWRVGLQWETTFHSSSTPREEDQEQSALQRSPFGWNPVSLRAGARWGAR